jgi:hypothetical protein
MAIAAGAFQRGFQLMSGRYYCTDGGDIVLIQQVDRAKNVAYGIFMECLMQGQWRANGTICDFRSLDDINDEVSFNEDFKTQKRNADRYTQ